MKESASKHSAIGIELTAQQNFVTALVNHFIILVLEEN